MTRQIPTLDQALFEHDNLTAKIWWNMRDQGYSEAEIEDFLDGSDAHRVNMIGWYSQHDPHRRGRTRKC